MSSRRPNRKSRHRSIHITGITTPTIEINNIHIHYILPKRESTSPLVNADRLEFFVSDLKFKRLKNGEIKMHIPVREKIDRKTPKRYDMRLQIHLVLWLFLLSMPLLNLIHVLPIGLRLNDTSTHIPTILMRSGLNVQRMSYFF
jgi:hypothetical protein